MKSCLDFAVSGVCSMLKMDSAVDAWTCLSLCILLVLSKLLKCVLQLETSIQFLLSSCLIGVHYLECGGHQLELKKVNNTSLVSKCLM